MIYIKLSSKNEPRLAEGCTTATVGVAEGKKAVVKIELVVMAFARELLVEELRVALVEVGVLGPDDRGARVVLVTVALVGAGVSATIVVVVRAKGEVDVSAGVFGLVAVGVVVLIGSSAGGMATLSVHCTSPVPESKPQAMLRVSLVLRSSFPLRIWHSTGALCGLADCTPSLH